MLPLLADHAAAAERLLEPEVWAYVSAGGVTTAEAAEAWSALRLRPRVLRDVRTVDTSLILYGAPLRTPVLVAPTAFHSRVHPSGEAGTSRGAVAAGSLMTVATRSDSPVESLDGPFWWQTYVLKDRAHTLSLALRARDAGAQAIVVTGDSPYVLGRQGGLRVDLGELEQDPAATFEVVDWLVTETGLPVLVKGVLRGDDARACVAAGATGIVVSNHGGRQLDRAVSTARALPEVAAAVDVPVLVDGGIRSGLDVLCALALGATAVLLGKPVLWALASDGADGVTACLAGLTEDLAHAMALAGCASLRDITPDLIVR
jgi:4-hydroxymandelate oxidase